MLLQSPLTTVTSALDGPVLQVLAGAHAPFSVANIANIIGNASPSGIRLTLHRLVRQGIVTERRFGRSVVYSFNHEHLAADGILALARIRDSFIRRLRSTIAAWEDSPHLAMLFGSAARGDMHEESDIDILIVSGPDLPPIEVGEPWDQSPDAPWAAQVSQLSDLVSDLTGNDCHVVEMTFSEFKEKVAAKDPLLANVEREGIPLFGNRSELTA